MNSDQPVMPSSVETLRNELTRQPASQCSVSILVIFTATLPQTLGAPRAGAYCTAAPGLAWLRHLREALKIAEQGPVLRAVAVNLHRGLDRAGIVERAGRDHHDIGHDRGFLRHGRTAFG